MKIKYILLLTVFISSCYGPPYDQTGNSHYNKNLGKMHRVQHPFYIRPSSKFGYEVDYVNFESRIFGSRDIWIPVGTRCQVIAIKAQDAWETPNFWQIYQTIPSKELPQAVTFARAVTVRSEFYLKPIE